MHLLRKSLGFHFSLMNMIPMMALAIKKKKKEAQGKENWGCHQSSGVLWPMLLGLLAHLHWSLELPDLSLTLPRAQSPLVPLLFHLGKGGVSLSLPEEFLQGRVNCVLSSCATGDWHTLFLAHSPFKVGAIIIPVWKMGTPRQRVVKHSLEIMQLASEG